jgi:pyruvate-formate lyase
MWQLRNDILASPFGVALDRARTYTRVFQETQGAPWIVRKALAFREHLRTVPLYLRPGDRLAGSICETPGAMPVFAELGIAENGIFTNENPERKGYLRGQVPAEIVQWWEERNLWGAYRAYMRTVRGQDIPRTEAAQYKFISCQGHLSPSYRELLAGGIGGLLQKVRKRKRAELAPEKVEFLTAAELCLQALSEWAARYGDLCESMAGAGVARAEDLREMARICRKVATDAPETFREALQLLWFAHQAIHIEGHGYSCTPDRLDQVLYPFYLADREAGRLTDDEALTLCENLILKQRDNSVWSLEHNLTQGLCVSGSTPDGDDQTNELSWLFIEAADRMSLPEPLVWIRWHPNINQDFFDFCLSKLAGATCFPLMMSDTAVPYMFMDLGVSEVDAFNYVPAGCNELAIPGMAYFNPCAHVGYLGALEQAMTQGRDYGGQRQADEALPPVESLRTFDDLLDAVGQMMERQVRQSYAHGLIELQMQRRFAQTPLTSCFFDGCVERGADMIDGTRYNILSCGGAFFANMVDCLAAIREVVYERREATLAEVSAACAADFAGHEQLRARLQAAPKHGNDDPRLRDLVMAVERLRDEPVRAICRDPRDGSRFGNSHVVRSSAVLSGRNTGATPDGRRAGAPLAGSVAASAGCEHSGPTAVLNSILTLDPVASWESGYNVNLRFQQRMLADAVSRARVRAMLNAFFGAGGQEMQINAVDTETLLAAQRDPAAHRDLVVRVAGFSEFFTRLDPAIQEDIIARTQHES